MPEELKKYILAQSESRRSDVFISCGGKNKADQEAIGPVTLTPPSIPSYHYPYKNIPGYLSPLVALQFTNAMKSTKINVECIAWSHNIIYHGGERDRSGSINFELVID